LSGNKDCQEFKFSIVRIVISVSNVTNVSDVSDVSDVTDVTDVSDVIVISGLKGRSLYVKSKSTVTVSE